MQLVVMIETGRADVYRGEARAPDIASLHFEPAAGGWLGSTTFDAAPEDCDRVLAEHLRALRDASREHPTWAFRIEIEPDGGSLTLLAGSFGTDEEEVATLLAWTLQQPLVFDGAHTKLYVSVRLPEDAHAHFLDLVAEGISPTETPVTDASPQAIAIGFELTESAQRTAALISALRYAWLAEGSLAEALVELEGPMPVVRRIDDLHGWTELERELRAIRKEDPEPEVAKRVRPYRAAIARTEVARVGAIAAFGDRTLTWIDERGRFLGAGADGVVWELPARAEKTLRAKQDSPGSQEVALMRRPDGTTFWRAVGNEHRAERIIELPLDPGIARTFHRVVGDGVLVTDRLGPETRVCLATWLGVERGPVFRNLRAVAAAGKRALVVADISGYQALVTVDPATWGWDHERPWPQDASVTDLAALGEGGAVVAANRDGGAQLYVVNYRTGEVDITAFVPATELRIVHVDEATVWVVGASPGRRMDLWRVDLDRVQIATLRTSMLSASEWGALHATRHGDHWVLAYAHAGVFRLGARAEALAALEPDERITALVPGPPVVAVATNATRSRLLVYDGELHIVTLPMIARDPLW